MAESGRRAELKPPCPAGHPGSSPGEDTRPSGLASELVRSDRAWRTWRLDSSSRHAVLPPGSGHRSRSMMVRQRGSALNRKGMPGRHGPAEGHAAPPRCPETGTVRSALAGSIPAGSGVHDCTDERATRGSRVEVQRADLTEWQTCQPEALVPFGASGFDSRDRYGPAGIQLARMPAESPPGPRSPRLGKRERDAGDRRPQNDRDVATHGKVRGGVALRRSQVGKAPGS